jgi:hypothetical protein
MRQAAGLALVALLLGGCVAYVGPYGGRPVAGGYASPVVVHAHWGWHSG